MITNNSSNIEIYIGLRGPTFISIIEKVLSKGLKKKYITQILNDPENINIFSQVFTHESAYPERPDFNYEIYEQLGDLTANKFIVHYMYNRFPQLKCTFGLKIVARLRINYGSRQSFYKIAEKLGFWDFITISTEKKSKEMKDTLEDVFEAFIGALEFIVDSKFEVGVGYAIVSKILKCLFDEIDISLTYENLYDPKTRLKELFNYRQDLGTIKYEETIALTEFGKITTSDVFIISVDNKKKKIGTGSSSLKKDSQQHASKHALSYLKNLGIFKIEPPEYALLSLLS
jgi:dsRNA-specific ribonuclease